MFSHVSISLLPLVLYLVPGIEMAHNTCLLNALTIVTEMRGGSQVAVSMREEGWALTRQ